MTACRPLLSFTMISSHRLFFMVAAVVLFLLALISIFDTASKAQNTSNMGSNNIILQKKGANPWSAEDTDTTTTTRTTNVQNSATGSIFTNTKIRTFDPKNRIFNHYYQTEPSNNMIDKYMSTTTNSTSSKNKNCERWGVVTTIFNPTEAIVRVIKSTSWCLVIVADTKTPSDYTDQLQALLLPPPERQDDHNNKNQNRTSTSANPAVTNLPDNIIYLSVEEQNKIASIDSQTPQAVTKFVRSTPWKHFSRKNIGYLFAIQHGAQFIFDFDDDNYIKLEETSGKPMDILPDNMILKDARVIMQGPNTFNHHPIMNASIADSWPRGFPIDLITNNATQGIVAYNTDLPLSGTAYGLTSREVGVLQYLADCNPDVDALHRLTKGTSMTFPLSQSSVLVPSHSYAPFNAQATIHTRNAMFAMLLPSTVPGRISDIWRGYFAQCLFGDIGLSLVFGPPKIVQERNDHNYLGDFDAEADLYRK